MEDESFKKLMLICYKLFIKDQNVAECLGDFPRNITEDFTNYIKNNYKSRYDLYNRYLTKANESLIITQSLRAVVKEYRDSL